MYRTKLWLAALCGLANFASGESRRYSTWMLDSIKSRNQGIESSGAASSTLESGVLAIALEAAITQYPDLQDKYAAYLGDVLDAATPTLTNATYDSTRPLDRFSVATSIDRASTGGIVSVSAQAASAYDALNSSLSLQNRNPDGGFWYYVYPQWSYLDGVFSVLPFMASQPHPNYTDIGLQISLLYDRCLQRNTSLLTHGYDYSRTAVWANKETGASPYVWGRSLGWFVAGLVQTWETLDCRARKTERTETGAVCNQIRKMTTQLSSALVTYADPQTGAWWQLTTFPGRSGNYLESSSTALFTFSLLKGARLGIFPHSTARFRKTALRAYNYTVGNFVTASGNGTIGFDKTVSVCSLNSTATYEYYTSRPSVPNSLLGESAFVLASLEVER